jgi:SAM-dependent methyltransferase
MWSPITSTNGIRRASLDKHLSLQLAVGVKMAQRDTLQQNYDSNADGYVQLLNTPLGTLEQQLFDLSITDCDGLRVLDLGGGTGLRARDALKAGARTVDVVDISQEMMRQGQQYEKSIGRDCIHWYHGDVSKPLDHLSTSLTGCGAMLRHISDPGAVWSPTVTIRIPKRPLMASMAWSLETSKTWKAECASSTEPRLIHLSSSSPQCWRRITRDRLIFLGDISRTSRTLTGKKRQ